MNVETVWVSCDLGAAGEGTRYYSSMVEDSSASRSGSETKNGPHRTGRRAEMRGSFQRLFDRQPPNAAEAEMAVLGALILDPKVLGEVLALTRSPEDFFDPRHAQIFRAVVEVYDANHHADLVTIVDNLRGRGVLEEVGGPDYLVELAESVPAAANGVYYARIVSEKARLRRLIDAAGDILHEAYHSTDLGPDGARQVIDRAEAAVFEIAQEDQVSDPQRLSELLQAEIDRLDASEGHGVTGVSTGYPDLDELTGGLQRGEMIVIAARPSMGKCLASDAELVLPDGSIATIEDLYRRRQATVPTLNDSLNLEAASVSDFIDDGHKPVFEVTTRLGRRVRTTLPHPFLTIDGWKPLAELCIGDRVAVPRRLPVFGTGRWRPCEIKLLAYLIGDGGLTGSVPRFSSGNNAASAEFAACVSEFGGLRLSRSSTRSWETPSRRIAADRADVPAARRAFGTRLRGVIRSRAFATRHVAHCVGVTPASVTHWMSGANAPDAPAFERRCDVLEVRADDLAPGGLERIRTNHPNPLTKWLTTLGLMGAGAHHKTIPPDVFTLQREQIALFLNRLFSTDGWATVLASGQSQLGYACVCERRARQVQHLLLRFGIIASLRQRWVLHKDARRPAWQLDITDGESIRSFARDIGMFGKEDALEHVLSALDRRARSATNRDTVPVEVWTRIAKAKGAMSWRVLSKKIGACGGNLHVGQRALSRPRLARIAAALGDAALADLAASDVYWDEIVSIEPLGERQVYDLTVPVTHNFVADDVCVHNTALALNIAEQIAFAGRVARFAPADGPRVPVAVFSLEMSKSAVTQRLLSAASGVDSHRLRSAHVSDHDYRAILECSGVLHTAPLFIDDTPALTLLSLRARARRLAAQYDIRALIIDYLQLLSAPNAARENRQVEVSAISRGVKALARELNVPVICLSQLNRNTENREGNRPRMSDLRESGSIEQDADVVILLHREDYYHNHDPDWKLENPDKAGVAELIIAKQRNGPTGVVRLTWDDRSVRFKSYSGPLDSSQAPPPVVHVPARSAFPSAKPTGPVGDFRDGGGPDRDAPDEAGGLPIG